MRARWVMGISCQYKLSFIWVSHCSDAVLPENYFRFVRGALGPIRLCLLLKCLYGALKFLLYLAIWSSLGPNHHVIGINRTMDAFKLEQFGCALHYGYFK